MKIGLAPVMFDATNGIGIGFTDDVNLETTVHSELEATVVDTMASCAAARITLEPSKEVRTTFYPPKHA